MKVLLISVFPPVQIADANHAYRIALHLADAGVEVHVLTQSGALNSDHPCLHIHPWMRGWNWAETPRVVRCLRKFKPDAILLVYVGHMYGNQPMVRFLPTVARLSRPQARFVTQIEHLEGSTRTGGLLWRVGRKVAWIVLKRGPYWVYGTLLSACDLVIVLSEGFLAVLEEIQPGVTAKSVLIPPPVLLRIAPANNGETRRRQRELLGIQPEETVLAFLGYLYAGKGVETLLNAFAQVCRRRANVRLIIVGGTVEANSDPSHGYVQKIQNLIDHLGIKERVLFSGGFDHDDDRPSRYLQAADIAVLPFDSGVYMNNSSFAGVVAHGLPVVTTRGPNLEAPFVDSQNVLLCPPKEPELMAEAIEAVMDNQELRRTLQVGSDRISREWFSWEGATERFLAALNVEPTPRSDGSASPASQ